MAKKLLVVDDDPVIRALLQTMLEAESFEVELAGSGAEALTKLSQEDNVENFAAILLDVLMPDMTGLDVLCSLRDKGSKTPPVIMLTGEAKADDIISGYQSGAEYYITKPFTRQQLLFGLNLVFSPRKV